MTVPEAEHARVCAPHGWGGDAARLDFLQFPGGRVQKEVLRSNESGPY